MVKTIDHFEQNRPVHLARRDVYFERAAALISDQQDQTFAISAEAYEEILYLLRVARQHAHFSIRHAGKNEDDEQFFRFINLLAGNVKAVLSMINLKGMVEEGDDGSFFSFLGANQASVALQSEEYQRRAMDIARSINNTLMLAQEPYELLKKANHKAADAEERKRYKKARLHFSRKVDDGLPIHHPLPGYRKGVHY